MGLVQNFINNPSVEGLEALRKADLVVVAGHYELGPVTNLRKDDIKELVLSYLVSTKIVDKPEVVDDFTVIHSGAADEGQDTAPGSLSELEKKEYELEIRKLQLELRERDLMLRERASQQGSGLHSSTGVLAPVAMETKVPRFTEEAPTEFFVEFEKAALIYKWPEDQWARLLRNVFTGAAYKAYSELKLDEILNYKIVKKAILKVYQLSPLEYQRRFRTSTKAPDVNFMSFIQMKKSQLSKWLESEGAEDYDGIFEVFLREEIRRWLPDEWISYLDVLEITDLDRMGSACDRYAFTHPHVNYRCKPLSAHPTLSAHQSNSSQGGTDAVTPSRRPKSAAPASGESANRETKVAASASSVPNKGKQKRCSNCREAGHTVDQCSQMQKPPQGSSKPYSFYCRKSGHIKRDCPEKLAKKAALTCQGGSSLAISVTKQTRRY